MNILQTKFSEVVIIESKSFNDFRGSFMKFFNKNFFADNNLESNFIDLNYSDSISPGVFRGFHYQNPPFDEVKLVKCIKGKIIDYIVDIRKNSKTYLDVISFELEANDNKLVYIPEGFAHGYMSIQKDSGIIYLSSKNHSPQNEVIINPIDPELNINFPLEPILSDKDKSAKFLK
jgi:dTDP-4-dehydrorhamnose 3,5-epimerase